MKTLIRTMGNIVLLAWLLSCQAAHQGFPVLKGPCLGQKLPGTTPEVFAPGIVSTGLYTRDIAMTADGDEIYFCVADEAVVGVFETRRIGGKWTEPAVATFSGKGFFDFEPHLSPDGKELYFLSTRPPLGMEPKPGWTHQNIWMTTRTDTGWSEPRIVGEPVSTGANVFFPSMTRHRTLYFTRSDEDSKARIFRAAFENGRFNEPQIVPFDVPAEGALFNAFVSPEEDFLILCAVGIDSTNTDQDYYIAFRSPEGRWGRLVKLGPEINVPGDQANSAFVSPDGKYLFFSSSRKDPSIPEFKSGTSLREILDSKSKPGYGSSAIWWVAAGILDAMRPKDLK